jgi:hypothetical protein
VHVVGSLILVNYSALQLYIFEWIKQLCQKQSNTPAKLYKISQREKYGLIQLRFLRINGISRTVFDAQMANTLKLTALPMVVKYLINKHIFMNIATGSN